ncbi:MAG: succinyl-diaminopimelate desuccinylase [Pseudomonadales bacterium]
MPTTNSPTLTLTKELIERPSVTPDDAGCQQLLAQRLSACGFAVEHLRYGEVDNLWAVFGNDGPLLAFAGHTDVVPTGPVEDWNSPPFEPAIRDGVLYGRGAADMKGSIAAMVVACEKFIGATPAFKGRIAFLITSDEEGPAVDGTVRVIDYLKAQDTSIDWCIVGEPSSTTSVGDVVKNGRRGSLNAHLRVHGTQGHVAYPKLADNPIHRALPALHDLTSQQWDSGNDFFPPTNLQVSNIKAGTGATNVIPSTLECDFNFRFSTEVTAEQLQETVQSILGRHEIEYSIIWNLSGQPFLTAEGELLRATEAAIQRVTDASTTLSTGGGTSDGRFIAPTGTQVVELGPCNASIHKVDEHVNCADLDTLSAIYEQILHKLFAGR